MSETPDPDPRTELRELDERIGELTGSIQQLREDLGDSSGALDSEERAAGLTNIEELEGSLDALQHRRETVEAKLKG